MAGGIRGPERRIVLMGESGQGKSATGNTILGSHVFECRLATKACQKEETWLKGRKIVVVDTPGLADTPFLKPDMPACFPVIDLWNPIFYHDYITTTIRKFVTFCSPGPHVILWAVRPFRFIHKEAAEVIKEVFSHKGKNYVILLITHKEDLGGKALEEFISEGDPSFRDQVSQCENRVLVFDNKAEGEEREAQVAQLMAMMDELVQKNENAPCYMEDMKKQI